MSETTELPAAETAPPAAGEKPRRRIWPLLAWAVIGGVIVAAGTVAALGTTGALIAGGCAAGAAAAGVILWRLPQLRRHFAGPRRAARMRTMQSRTRRTTTGGGRAGKPRLGLGLGKGRAGKLPGTGRPKGGGRAKGAAGKLGRAAGKLVPGRLRSAGRALGGKGRGVIGRLTGRRHGTAAGPGGRRPGLVRRTAARIMSTGRKRAAARAAAGKKPRSRPAAVAAGIALPAIATVRGIRKLVARARKRKPGGDGQEPAADPKPEPKPKPPEEPPAPVPARRPGQPRVPGKTDHPIRRRHPVAHQLEAAKEAIEQGVGGFEPENIDDLGHFLQSLPGVYEALASGLHRVAERFADELPLHPDVAEHLREMASGAAGQQEYAGEAHQIFRAAHEDELNRLENPRPGEQLWDVVENQ